VFHQQWHGLAYRASVAENLVRHTTGGKVQFVVCQRMILGFDRKAVRILPSYLSETLDNRLFDLVPAKFDESTVGMKAFRTSKIV
jgi:hypothetical protein